MVSTRSKTGATTEKITYTYPDPFFVSDDEEEEQPVRKRRHLAGNPEEHHVSKERRPKAKLKKSLEQPHECDVPRYLVVTEDMKRPPGEKHPPQLWDVPKKRATFDTPKAITEWPRPWIKMIEKLDRYESEFRLTEYNDEPTEWHMKALERASTERLFMIECTRQVEASCHAHNTACPVELIRIAGSSGNVYTVYISHLPSCTCMDHRIRKRACKHISYVINHTLKVPEHLRFQESFLSSELEEIAEAAPPILAAREISAIVEAADGNRKPVEDDCPICCQEFEADEDVVWCKTSCGNNMHEACFSQWSKSKTSHGEQVTCPFCRATWNKPKPKAFMQHPETLHSHVTMPSHKIGGYVNVRDQLDYGD